MKIQNGEKIAPMFEICSMVYSIIIIFALLNTLFQQTFDLWQQIACYIIYNNNKTRLNEFVLWTIVDESNHYRSLKDYNISLWTVFVSYWRLDMILGKRYRYWGVDMAQNTGLWIVLDTV